MDKNFPDERVGRSILGGNRVVDPTTTPQHPPLPWPTSMVMQHCNLKANVIYGLLVQKPRVLQPQEYRSMKNASLLNLQEVLRLEALYGHPGADEKGKSKLAESKFFWQLHYWRLFPVNDLPDDILLNIFSLCAWAGGPAEGINNKLTITWVCRRWRNLALNDGTLWNAIWFRDFPHFERSFAFLERAKNASLDLRISDVRAYPRAPLPLSFFEQLIAAVPHYWRTQIEPIWKQEFGLGNIRSATSPPTSYKPYKFNALTMESVLRRCAAKIDFVRVLIVLADEWKACYAVMNWLADAGKSGAPLNFQHVEIQRCWDPNTDFVPVGTDVPPIFGGKPAPHLREICFKSVSFDWGKSILQNLTSLDLRWIPHNMGMTMDQFRQVLMASPRLEALKLDGTGRAMAPEELSHPPISLPYLKTLLLGHLTPAGVLSWCAQFTAPNIRDLAFVNFTAHDYSAVWAMLTDRFKEVRILTFYSVQIAFGLETALARFVASMPLVEMLSLANVNSGLLMPLLSQANGEEHRGLNLHRLGWAKPKDLGPTKNQTQIPNPAEVMPPFTLPALRIIQVQAQELDDIVRFAIARRFAFGAPIQKVYLMGETKPDLLQFSYISKHIPQVVCVPLGVRTDEEIRLLSDD